MARPRLPQDKAEVSGATTHDPQRFRDRKTPSRKRSVGEPYLTMTDAQKAVWEECKAEMPWLHSAHRLLLRQACILAARMETDAEFGVSATQALSSILSKLGATPVDETKVMHGDDGDEDPSERFFARPN